MIISLTYEVIGADGAWLGSSTRDVIAEELQAIYPGSIIVISDARGLGLVVASPT